MWQILMFLATFSFAFARLIQRSLLKDGKHDSYTYSIYFQLLVAFLILPVALLTNFTIPALGEIWPQMLLMILLYGFANIFFYLAVKQTPISEVMVIAATMPVWTALTSTIFLGDKLNFIKFLGIALAVLGVAVVFYQKNELKLNKGHLYAFLSIISFGFALTNDSFLLKHFNQATYSFLFFLLPGLFLALINPKKISNIKPLFADNSRAKFIGSAVLYATAALLINTSLKIGAQASQVGVMLQLSPIFVIALGAIFLNEKDNLVKKLVGGIIVVIGVLLI